MEEGERKEKKRGREGENNFSPLRANAFFVQGDEGEEDGKFLSSPL